MNWPRRCPPLLTMLATALIAVSATARAPRPDAGRLPCGMCARLTIVPAGTGYAIAPRQATSQPQTAAPLAVGSVAIGTAIRFDGAILSEHSTASGDDFYAPRR